MAQKTTGALVFDERTDRYDIRFDLASYYGGLHCGDCFDVFTRGKWKPTRIEMNMKQEWYLVGIRADDLNGLRVRISPPPHRPPRKEGKTPCRTRSTRKPLPCISRPGS